MGPKSLTTDESGATLVEVMVAAAILGIVAVGAVIQTKSFNTVRAAMDRGQALDVIELSTSSLLARDDVIEASAAKASGGALKACLAGKGTCKSNGEYAIDMYLPRQNTPFAGASVGFDNSGSPCNTGLKANCKSKYRQTTTVITRCNSSSDCSPPLGVSVRFSITEISNGEVLREDQVDRSVTYSGMTSGMNLSCPNYHVLRGVGLKGEALCTKLSDIEYEDVGNTPPSMIFVKPGDCRTKNTNANDQYFVNGFDTSGVLSCKQKEW